MVRLVGLEGQPLLLPEKQTQSKIDVDLSELTAKEYLLLEYLKSHADKVCTKDELVHAIWPEDVIYKQGIRDESLAQLVRRLRVKIEMNPTEPHFIQTIPGRGYLFRAWVTTNS
jgi:DNA-binding winged helix-turn-helix (wHTH) protein